MATRIRTLNFLPEIFKTTTNSQFLQASLDQIVDQPNLTKIQGYIGSKFGYGINAKDYYVTEPSKVRTDYQLDPGVVFTKTNESVATDFISYPGINDALAVHGGIVNNNDRLYTSDFYSWDSFTNLDTLINYNQYYWLPSGLPAVGVSADVVYSSLNYTVTNLDNAYEITPQGETGSLNPPLTLLRGGKYTFTVDQNTQFWIQGEPGVTGYSATQPNMQTRDVYGVTNNGASHNIITFDVPHKNAQDNYILPGNNSVDCISTIPFSQVQGMPVKQLGSIDGITSLNGLTVMFYGSGLSDQYGYLSKFYGSTLYDENGGVPYNQTVDFPGSDIYDFNYEGGFYSQTNLHFYKIVYVGDPGNPIIQLVENGIIPDNEKITAKFGVVYGNRSFYRDVYDTINIIPYISAPLDTLYYQDSSNPNKVGIIKLVESNITNIIDVENDILGKKQYTSGNGVKFTNGLKIVFTNHVTPEKYNTDQYYVQGVGTAIELIPVSEMLVPELSSGSTYIPYDMTPYDATNYDSGLYIPVIPDYITIARNSMDKNAWSRSNRWFHVDVINATAEYNSDPDIATTYATKENKAKRPIIEFYPNLRLFNSGTHGKAPIDFIDTRAKDAFVEVAGQSKYYPDTAAYTTYTATINGVSGPITLNVGSTDGFYDTVVLSSGSTDVLHINDPIVFNSPIGGLSTAQTYYVCNIVSSTSFQIAVAVNDTPISVSTDTNSVTALAYPRSTNIVVNTDAIKGTLLVGQFVQDLYLDPSIVQVLPNSAIITKIERTNTITTISVSWSKDVTFSTITHASIVSANTTLDNYQLFSGARIVFASDDDLNVKNKIYVVEFTTVTTGTTPVITLTEAQDGAVFADDLAVIFRGYNYAGYSFYFDGLTWKKAQTKTRINQAPYFDIFDQNGISLGNKEVYTSSSFTGSTLFAYGIGSGLDDSVLGFPLKYSSINNVGDISFDVTLNSDTFNYVVDLTPKTENVNIGYVYQYLDRTTYSRQLGWQTAISPSVQYQVFEFTYLISNTTKTFKCDVPLISANSTSWPLIQVYVNNEYQTDASYIYTTSDTETTVSFNIDIANNTPVQILLLSDVTSKNAYYQIPINLNNNPLNEDVTSINVGDIRGHYLSIFYNNPNTTGIAFGSNNYRDLGNLVPWGNRIIQNSASLALPGAFLRKQNHSLLNALQFNNNQYITFKSLLVNTVNNTDYSGYTSSADMLDDAIDQITANKSQTDSFFYSDMLPSKSAYLTNTYSFQNSLDISIYPLTRIYDYSSANYYGVLVYLTRTVDKITTVKQLIRNIDYTVSEDSPSLTVTIELLPNDLITIKEYNQTYGSYVPNTPTKLGLYPATIPEIVLDSHYMIPTYFIVGHDGSFTKLYGNYDPTTGLLDDLRDRVLLEYETRVYNNLKLSNRLPIQPNEVIPGFFRNVGYSYDEFLEIYSESFLNWIGQNRIQYKEQIYNRNDEYTFNYRDNSNKLNNEPLEIGYWRGIYQYFYDTSTPDSTPWEMIGYRNMPSWWTARYGVAPYTSENLILWTDLENGVDWNNGNPVVIKQYMRPGLLKVIPVDSSGNLVSPFNSILGSYNGLSFQKDWIVGDCGPAEFAFRRSSSWPFALMRVMALTQPAKFYNLGVDLDKYKYNAEFNQYLINNRSHLQMSDIDVYGSGTAVTSYINWIIDYEKQVGVDATTQISNMINNLDVRLIYRLAGFSDKEQLRFYVEKGTPNSRNASLLIPDESYSILLYDNQPQSQLLYSGVVVQIVDEGYRVYGNSQSQAYFRISVPKPSVKVNQLVVENLSTKVYEEYYEETVIIPYGTIFYTVQEVSQFLASYGNYLSKQGIIFSEVQAGIEINWNQMVLEYLYWAQMGWEVGSIVSLNPSATKLEINKENNIPQPMVLRQQNFVLNQNLMPIDLTNLSVVRDGTSLVVQPVNQGDAISYGQFNMSSIEHGIVFDNVTLFNDVVYSLITGLRQLRIYVRGAKTAEWNGTLDAQGFILNQDNITEWDSTVKYTKGSIVKYKNKYWSAISIVQPKETFNEKEWIVTDYNEIQKGLLPNSSTNSYESTLYYDVNKANLKNDADLLSFSLIGYRPRDYLALVDLTDITQVNVYQNLIKNKGTLNAASAFKGTNLPQGGFDYNIYENWAIQTGEFGGILNSNFVDIKLNEADLPNNPSTVALTDGYNNIDADMEVPLYAIFNYKQPITSSNILSTIPAETPSKIYPDAGYVNYNDVKLSSYYYAGLTNAVNQYGTAVPLSQLYVRDYIWLANFLQKWQVLAPKSIGSVIFAQNNLNGTVTITFSEAQTLTQYQPFAIVNFNSSIDGYYLVAAVLDPHRVIINLSLNPVITKVSGLGVAISFQSQRVAKPSDIINLPLLDSEFSKNKVWVDTDTSGSWAVYRKSNNYQLVNTLSKSGSSNYGSCLAYNDALGYIVGDSDLGKVYRYEFNSTNNEFILKQELSNEITFGSALSYVDDTVVISATSGNVYIYQLVTVNLFTQLQLVQTIASPIATTSWGASTALSGDKNWLYISNPNYNLVYAYRKNQINVDASTITVGNTYMIKSLGDTDWNAIAGTSSINYIVGNVIIAQNTGSGTGIATDITFTQVQVLTNNSLILGDQYGTSITTDYYGDTVVIGAPKQNDGSLDNVGFAYVYNKIVQRVETQYSSLPYNLPQTFNLVSPPVTVVKTATNTSESGYANFITVSGGLAGISVGNAVVFSGTLISGGTIQSNKVYYVVEISGSRFKISETRGGTPITLITTSGSMTCNFQTELLTVTVNGSTITDNNYFVIGSIFNIRTTLNIGDIITVFGNSFAEVQVLDSQKIYNIGEQFGQSVDITQYGSEIVVGAPFTLSLAHDANQEGSVFRYTNSGNKYGMIVGTTACEVTTNRSILLNGYAVYLTPGDASHIANIINTSGVTNVLASVMDSKLVISLIDSSLAIPNNKLTLQVLDKITLSELGITLYTQTQTLVCPHKELHSQFGYSLKLNEQESLIISARTGNRYSATTFDFVDDELDNDTVFDNNTTTWNDLFVNAGAVYMFDYLANYNETLDDTGKYVYAQSVNSNSLNYGTQPYYGTAVDFNNSHVIISSPGNGTVTVYQNQSGEKSWSVFRQSGPVVDIEKIQNALIYSASTNDTLVNLDYIDPLQDKILGTARQNLDFVSNIDPASYNNPLYTQGGEVWGASMIGKLWFDTSAVRFVNYHQQDFNYNNKWWGKVFPGSNVAVYSFISSNTIPASYVGPGTPYDVNSYTIEYIPNQTGTLTPIYFYWVRNTNIIFTETGKTLSDSIIESYITNPQNTGISYFAPVQPNAFSLYNSLEYINYTDSVFHIGYSTNSGKNLSHSQYSLIRSNYADDFLPGLPETTSGTPLSLYEKLLDSLSGLDRFGSVVPDPYLPLPVQSGILTKPRQSFFYDRYAALKNLVQYMNSVLLKFPFSEIGSSKFLFKTGPINPSTGKPQFDVSNYIINTNWWAEGYDNNTKATVQVPIYADLATLTVPTGTIVSVARNGAGLHETYIYDVDGLWTRIGLQYGTVQISEAIYNYSATNVGFGDNFFDTVPYDAFPSEETRYIVRAICEELPADLTIYRNKLLILLFEFIESETIESQNFLPWLNKTSFIDVSHDIRELKPLSVYQTDNQEFLEGYLNEVKPYHVVIKEFLFKYTGSDVFDGDITDFDLPAKYDAKTDQFVSPQLVFNTPTNASEFNYDSPIWQSNSYSQWFNNYGVSITGQKDYNISTLISYVALNSNAIAIDNASGFPINGVITIDEEQIAYSNVDRALNVISGLNRGFNGTTITNHIPGAPIYMNLPSVLVLYGGRGYTEPPRITAYIDSIYPTPREKAVLSAVMSLDTVQSIVVNNPGIGYATLPKIEIDPAFTVAFTSSDITLTSNTIQLTSNLLRTGDIITYKAEENAIQGLISGQYYYVNVLETAPIISIALYSSYKDCVLNQYRIKFYGTGSGNHTLSVGAIASCITSARPIRENNISLKFDRTSYKSQIVDWTPGNFYGSYYAGAFNYREVGASSSIKLESTTPDINTVLASAGGASFEILNVENVETIKWSTRTRNVIETYGSTHPTYVNTIKIEPSSGGAPVEGTIGSTVGFYIGMPIKFTGVSFGNIQINTTYYVESLITVADEDVGFRIAASYEDAINGIPVVLLTAIAPSAGMIAEPGEVTNQAIIKIDYPGIRKATQTFASDNTIMIPMNSSGLGGTQGFYPGLMLFFVGNTFGNIIENEIYYITSVIDSERFTISKTQEILQLKIYGAVNSSDAYFPNTIISENSTEINVNDPIIFSNFVINGTESSTFAGLESGKVYYIANIASSSRFSVSATKNGSIISLTTVSPASNTSGEVTNQRNVVQLTDAIGSVNAEINLPISPGQVTGQEFTLYKTSQYYTNPSYTVSDLVSYSIGYVIGMPFTTAINRIVLNKNLAKIYQVYVNMPIRISNSIGGLTTGTTYYVTQFGTTQIEITETDNTDNGLICSDTSVLYPGMSIIFSVQSIGGILNGVNYFVKNILSSSKFTISETAGGAEFNVFTDSGSMTGTGEAYVTVSTSPGGADVTLTSSLPIVDTTIDQYIESNASFGIRYLLGGYSSYVINAGSGYAVDNKLYVTGDQLGGSSPENDLTMIVNSVDDMGGITGIIRNGNPVNTARKYYLKAINQNQLSVYVNALMTIPVSGIDFAYDGIFTTTVSELAGTHVIVDDLTGFSLNDPIVFTGEVIGNIVAGQIYYIKTISSYLTISETLTGSTFTVGSGQAQFTVAKINDFALLPEPFYFNQSIVKFNHRVYRCIVSNNDVEFVFGKWEELNSGDNVLNAMDRVVGYYEPTINMPGADLTQLFTGVTYPNSTYKGNAFAPDDEYTLDTILIDSPFYPAQVNMVDVVWNGSTYIAPGNTSTYTVNVIRDPVFMPEQLITTWSLESLSNSLIGASSIYYASSTGNYVITTTNKTTPILISQDGYQWTAPGNFTPYDSTPYSDTNFDLTSIIVPSVALYNTTYHNGLYVSVGESILISKDAYSWSEVYVTSPDTTLLLKDVSYFNLPGFIGYIAVGKITNNNTSVTTGCVLTSADGYVWINPITGTFTNNELNSIASDGTVMVAVGKDGIVYYSTDSINWLNFGISGSPTLNSIAYASGLYIAVGNGGYMQVSTDGVTWTVRSLNVSENLNSIAYSDDVNGWIAVGDNNTIITSFDTINWFINTLPSQQASAYTVTGDEFSAGYAPEELVAGVVTDNLTMTVNTRPGTNWKATEYQHVGYGVISLEISPEYPEQTVYSFANIEQSSSQIQVFVINQVSGLSTTLYPTNYSVNWIEKNVTLNNQLSSGNTLRIDVYTVGNGDQLAKSNTDVTPYRVNDSTGFTEIFVNCNYSAPIYSGSGVIRTGEFPIETFATNTRSSDDTILVENVNVMVLNNPIRFLGAVFGGIEENTVYYVKSISYASSRITISDQFNSGVAGPTFTLSDASGLMDALIQIADSTPWTEPIIYHNGDKLSLGHVLTVTKTNAGSNTIVCNTTISMRVNEKIVFSDTMFTDSNLEPMRIYYIESIVNANEFTVSLTPSGPVIILNDATGGASCIIGDYGFGIQPNGISAKIVFSGKEDPTNPGYVVSYYKTEDYISYTLFGETAPIQYGYTIPETQYIIGDGSSTFTMTNYNDGDNPYNAIVEIDGIRKTYGTDYTISGSGNSITFTSSPAIDANIAITTYNLTDRQYFNTQYDITNTIVSSIISINNAITPPSAILLATSVTNTDITVNTTSSVFVGSTAYFQGSSFGGIDTTGTIYYVVYASGTTIRVSATQGGSSIDWGVTDSGSMQVTIGGQPAIRVTTVGNHELSTNDRIRIDATIGSEQLNNNVYYARVINSTQIDLYNSSFSSTLSVVNDPVTTINSYISGGYLWKDQTYLISNTTVSSTNSINSQITVDSTATLIVGTPVVFTQVGSYYGSDILGGIIAGTTYYIKEVVSGTAITISETQEGDIFQLMTDTASGNPINIAQWEQTNVDRLWITVNGYRVPSSRLRINAGNNISILVPIVSSDVIIITSMMPSATPNEEIYLQMLNKNQEFAVYKANETTSTYLALTLLDTSIALWVDDVSKIVSTYKMTVTVPMDYDPYTNPFEVGLPVDKNIISNIAVFNDTGQGDLYFTNYELEIQDLAPVLVIYGSVQPGDQLTITILLGNLIYVNGEQIRFTKVIPNFNVITGLQRGVNGTPVREISEIYTPVYGLLSSNKMSDVYYNQVWNSSTYASNFGDPLQISSTLPADFLNSGNS